MPVELKSLLTTLPNSVNIIIAHVGTSDTTWQQSIMTKSDFSTLVDSGILRVLYLCYIWPYSKRGTVQFFVFYIDYCWQVCYSK